MRTAAQAAATATRNASSSDLSPASAASRAPRKLSPAPTVLTISIASAVGLLAGLLPGIFVGGYFATRIPKRALQLVLATPLFVVASRVAYDHATAASSMFTAFTRRAVP